MRVTGWTMRELRAAPSSVVRAHFVRIFAGLIWNPDLVVAASGPPPMRGHYADPGDYAVARSQRARQIEAMKTMEQMLWPEDDDG